MVRLLTLLVTLLAGPALAAEPLRALPTHTECPVKLPEDAQPPGGWTPQEHWAWEQICLGKWANMANVDVKNPKGRDYDNLTCKPHDIEAEGKSVPDHRVLSPEFLTLILVHAPWATASVNPQINIMCADIQRRVSLENQIVGPELFLVDSRVGSNVNLQGAVFKRTLSLQGSKVDGDLNADSLVVEGEFMLHRGAVFDEIDIKYAKIGGSLIARGSTFNERFRADGITVGNSVYLDELAQLSDVILTGARIGGSLAISNSTITGRISGDRLKIKGSLFARRQAKVQQVTLSNAKIDGSLQMHGSHFHDAIDLSGARIGEMSLFHPFSGDANWKPGASLVLRNTKVNVLLARPTSWLRDGLHIDVEMSGFEYTRLGRPVRGEDTTMIDASGDALVRRLEGVRPNDSYDPGTYEHLTALLRREGMDGKADTVEYAKFERRSKAPPSGTEWWDEDIFWPLSKWLIGYGVYPFRALVWFAGLVLLGVIIGAGSRDTENLRGWGDRLWYSLENAIPLVEPAPRHRRIDHQQGFVESFFHLQKLLGFVIATYLVGALSLPLG